MNTSSNVLEPNRKRDLDGIKDGCLGCCWFIQEQKLASEKEMKDIQHNGKERNNFSESKAYVEKRKIKEIVSLDYRTNQSASKSKNSQQSKTTLFEKRSNKEIETTNPERNYHKKVSSLDSISNRRGEKIKV